MLQYVTKNNSCRLLEVNILIETDFQNANKLKNYSNLLTICASNIKDDNNNLNSQISNLELDTTDLTNDAICKKVEKIKLNIDQLTKVLGNMSIEAQSISAKLSIVK